MVCPYILYHETTNVFHSDIKNRNLYKILVPYLQDRCTRRTPTLKYVEGAYPTNWAVKVPPNWIKPAIINALYLYNKKRGYNKTARRYAKNWDDMFLWSVLFDTFTIHAIMAFQSKKLPLSCRRLHLQQFRRDIKCNSGSTACRHVAHLSYI